jgi:nucleoside-diphosphate-sugar epimerase
VPRSLQDKRTIQLPEKDLTIAITGGAGRIGRLVAAELRGWGARLRILDLPQANFEGLSGQAGIEVFPGDITDRDYVTGALADSDVVVHLAAVLPPVADENEALAQKVNVGGTASVLAAMSRSCPDARLVFSSSVVVYGNTQAGEPPVACDRELAGVGSYARSKVDSEALIAESGIPVTILRVSGVAVAEALMPPQPWPFTAGQRMEFVLLEDAAGPLARAAKDPATVGRTYNVAGGESWRMRGSSYSADYYGLLMMAPEDAGFLEESRAFDFYDTANTVADLGFVPTPYDQYLERTRSAIQVMFGI